MLAKSGLKAIRVFMMVKYGVVFDFQCSVFSNSATAFDISGLQIIHCLNLSSSSVRATSPLSPCAFYFSCCSWSWSNFKEEKAFLVLDTTKFLLVSNSWKIEGLILAASPCRIDEWTYTGFSYIDQIQMSMVKVYPGHVILTKLSKLDWAQE